MIIFMILFLIPQHFFPTRDGTSLVFSEWTIYMWQVRRKPQALPQISQCSGHTEVGHDHARCKSDKTAESSLVQLFRREGHESRLRTIYIRQLQKKAEAKNNQKGVLQAMQRLWL